MRGKNRFSCCFFVFCCCCLFVCFGGNALGFKGARYLLIIHELLVAMIFFPAGVQDETLKK